MGTAAVLALAWGLLAFMVASWALLAGVGRDEITALLMPLGERLGQRGGPDLERRLSWARVPTVVASGPAWMAMRLLLPAGAVLSGAFIGVTGGEPAVGVLLAFIGGLVGFLYPSVWLNGRVRRRQALIHRDVPRFLGAFARALNVQSPLDALMSVHQAAAEENAKRRLAAEAGRSRTYNPYGSALWEALDELLAARATSMVRPGATTESPDPLIGFALTCNEPEIERFAEMFREAILTRRKVTVEAIERLIVEMNAARAEELKRAATAAESKATVVLVVFNMPLLLAVTIIPPILGLFLGFGR